MEAAKSYSEGLGKQKQAQYFDKLKLIGGKDPYELAPLSWTDDTTVLPNISYPDIVSPSPFTAKTLNVTKVWRPITRWCVEG